MARASQGPKRHEHHRFCKINAAGGGGGGGVDVSRKGWVTAQKVRPVF